MRTGRPTALRALFSSTLLSLLKPFLRSSAPALAAAALLGFSAAAVSPAAAQAPAIVKSGYAAVTGFSGVVAFPAPDGADPFDYVSVNTDGPAARVINLTQLGPQGTLSTPPKPFSVSAAQVGQVFGVTLDNAPQPNIYLAATSIYGLNIYTLDGDGQLHRVHKGTAGAQFVPGQFGPPEVGGGPGSIWRVSGVTGEVSLLTTVDSGTGSVAGLGALAYDPASQQIFVSERGTGLIYRIGVDGSVNGTYDHGTEGRPAAGLPPVAMTPAVPVNIESAAFDTGNPKTWGLAAPARRIFGLAVFNKRLYYSVGQGPQIWSTGISASGALPGSDARLEVEVPSLADGVEITSITFDNQGRMYLAERGVTNGDYYLYQLAADGQSRVLRYLPKPAGDPAPGRWKLDPDQYAIGMPPVYNNAAGGVALNYGYGQTNKINSGACGATVWSTGDQLLDPGDGTPPDGYPPVEGLQGNANSLVQPQNAPPTAAWFVDYDDQAGDASLRGYAGAIATLPCAGAPVPKPPPPVVCPQGTYFSNGNCLIYPVCPQGTTFKNGQCVYPQCPPGFYPQGNQCVPPPSCPPGSVFYKGQCVPLGCPQGLVPKQNGSCDCPNPNDVYLNGQCQPPQQCKLPYVQLGDVCFCPLELLGGDCKPPKQCKDNEILSIEGKCEPLNCPNGQEAKNHACVPITCKPNQDLFNGKCVPKCSQFQFHKMPDGACGFLTFCLAPKELFKGNCVNPCPKFTTRQPDGSCKSIIIQPNPIFCLAPKEMVNGNCVNPCPKFTTRQPDGTCKSIIIQPNPIFCLAPKEMVNGNCVNPCPKFTTRQPDGTCKSIIIQPNPIFCLAPKEMVNGNCVNPCPKFTTRQPDGTCKSMIIQPNPIFCLAPKEMVNGNCVNPCPKFTTRQPDGTCKSMIIQPNPVFCLAPKEMVNGNCVPPCPKFTNRQPDGSCKPIFKQGVIQVNPNLLQPICVAPNEVVNGNCVPPCQSPATRQQDGTCKIVIKLPNFKLQIQQP